MTKLRIAATASLGFAIAALVAGTVLAAGGSKTVAFTGRYSGKAVVRVTGSKADIPSASATGTGTLVGRSKLSGKGAGVGADPCGTFGGPGFITAANGRLNFVIAPTGGSACGDESGQVFSLVGRATFKGGTRKYVKARGTFKFTGTYDKGTGSFAIRLIGTLTV